MPKAKPIETPTKRTRKRTPNNRITTGFTIADELWGGVGTLLPKRGIIIALAVDIRGYQTDAAPTLHFLCVTKRLPMGSLEPNRIVCQIHRP